MVSVASDSDQMESIWHLVTELEISGWMRMMVKRVMITINNNNHVQSPHRMHDMSSMTQVAQIEAHDSEVLCLEFTSPEAG